MRFAREALASVVLLLLSCINVNAQAVQVQNAELCVQATTGQSGLIGVLGTIVPGAGGAANVYTNVPLTGGSGTGATANITVGSAGGVTAVNILSPGLNYQVSDVLSVPNGYIGVSGFSVVVNSISINSSLAGGSMAFYIPGTLTPSQTWQDAAQTTQNQNPVQLNANGCAVVFGIGTYRQIVYDSLGNVVWDKLTSVAPISPFWAGNASGTASAITVADPAFAGVDGQSINFLAKFNNPGAATLATGAFGPAPLLMNSTAGPVPLTQNAIVAGNVVSAIYSTRYASFLVGYSVPQNTYPVIDVVAYGAVGDGATINNTAIQTALNAAAPGNMIRFPCGVYKMTAQPVVTVAAGKHLTVQGSGPDCTVLYMSGGVGGLTINYGSVYSSADVNDMTFTTDQVGGQTGLTIQSLGVPPLAQADNYGPTNTIRNVNFRGFNQYGADTNYWGVAFNDVSVSNVDIIGGVCNGVSTAGGPPTFGTCYSLNGNPATQIYAVIINFFGTITNDCQIGVYYGNWVQGVNAHGMNSVGCSYGITTASTVNSGANEALDGLQFIGGQIQAFVCGICINESGFDQLIVSGAQFIVEPNAVGIKAAGNAWVITGNQFGAIDDTDTTAIQLGEGGLATSIASGNEIYAFAFAFASTPGVDSVVQLVNNTILSSQFNYVIQSGSSGIQIIDINPTVFPGTTGPPATLLFLPTCSAAIVGSKFLLINGNTGTYDANITAIGTFQTGAYCDGTNWKAQ